jgi:hypothetical protein
VGHANDISLDAAKRIHAARGLRQRCSTAYGEYSFARRTCDHHNDEARLVERNYLARGLDRRDCELGRSYNAKACDVHFPAFRIALHRVTVAVPPGLFGDRLDVTATDGARVTVAGFWREPLRRARISLVPRTRRLMGGWGL